jgi:hypothetical protein
VRFSWSIHELIDQCSRDDARRKKNCDTDGDILKRSLGYRQKRPWLFWVQFASIFPYRECLMPRALTCENNSAAHILHAKSWPVIVSEASREHIGKSVALGRAWHKSSTRSWMSQHPCRDRSILHSATMTGMSSRAEHASRTCSRSCSARPSVHESTLENLARV